ncbi:MAG: tryptophan--tRNA ligase [Bacteroidales bacterium]|nr:tryptophan--tRNA ligase [Bacteroidales bacterium]MCF8328633.1 tryptophan--tRNA ligase [Bacteroidales bacterium]
MEKIVSGIRPTGNLHLGNYFGAVKNFLRLQEEHNCYFFIADYHSLTTHPTPGDLTESVKNVLVEYLACGLDPEKATIYLQSDVQEVAELYLLLNMNAYMGELQRVASFKEKARKQPQNINAGLLTYPVLMAADILLHHASKVPVGQDQQQHLEMTRTFARRFNNMYKVDYFPEPEAYNFGDNLIKVPGLDGSGKMGKSETGNNAIFLSEDLKKTRKKIMRAVTDAGPTQKNQEKPEVIQNLFKLMSIVSSKDTVEYFDEQYNECKIRYGDMKKQLAEDVIRFVEPIKQNIDELHKNEEYLNKVFEQGAERAKENAGKTIRQVREIIGFKNKF